MPDGSVGEEFCSHFRLEYLSSQTQEQNSLKLSCGRLNSYSRPLWSVIVGLEVGGLLLFMMSELSRNIAIVSELFYGEGQTLKIT